MNFNLIPGPKSFPLVGTLYKYLPIIGSQWSFDAMHKTSRLKYDKYGSIVREEFVPGSNIVWLFDPDDIQCLFLQDGHMPIRRSHFSVAHYRLQSGKYSSLGLLPINGPDWRRFRSAYQKGLSFPDSVKCFLPASNRITDEWLTCFAKNMSTPNNFIHFLEKLFLEQLCASIFGFRLNGFSDDPASSRKGSDIIDAVSTINDNVLQSDIGFPFWKYFATPRYRKIAKAHRKIDAFADEFLTKRIIEYDRKRPPQCVLDHYLENENLRTDELMGIVADFLLAGTDTSTHVAAYVLFNLAQNQTKQNALRNETKAIFERDITSETLEKAIYAKACVKEAQRLTPIAGGVGRELQNDMILSGYKIPKGTTVVAQNQIICRLEKYFKNADCYVPERWIRGNDAYQKTHPFLVLPFGYGPRSCIAKRFAEQNLIVFVLKMIKNIEVNWNGDKELDFVTCLINKPNKPLRFHFEKCS